MAGEGKGWISVYRSIQDHWLWQEKPFSKGQAWLDLLLSANHQDSKIMFDSNLVEVKKGQFITSIRKLCERWGWSNSKLKKFLEILQNDGMIFYKSDSKKTIINIVNYSVYQDVKDTKNDTEAFQRDTPGEDSGVNGSSGFGLKNGLKNGLTTFEKNMEKSDGSKLGVSMDSGKQGITETSQKHHRNVTETSLKHTNNNDNNDNNDNKNSSSSAAKSYPQSYQQGYPQYIEFFNNNFHLISPYEAEILNSFIKDGLDEEVILLGLKKAVANNVRTIKYVKRILQNWLDKGIKTVTAVEAEQREFKRAKESKQAHKQEYKSNVRIPTAASNQRKYDGDELEKMLLGRNEF